MSLNSKQSWPHRSLITTFSATVHSILLQCMLLYQLFFGSNAVWTRSIGFGSVGLTVEIAKEHDKNESVGKGENFEVFGVGAVWLKEDVVGGMYCDQQELNLKELSRNHS